MRLILAVALLLVGAPSLGIAAPAVVIKSTVGALAVGALIDEAQAIEVPAGGSVTFVTPQGATLTRNGPFSGPAVGAGGGGGNESAVKTIAGFLGKKGTETRVGAVRAVAVEQPEDPWVVPVSTGGRYCARVDGALLWRPDGGAEETYTLRDVAQSAQADVVFGRTETTAPWPAALPVRDGATYLIRTKGGVRSIRVVLSAAPADLAADAAGIAWMIDQGCNRQADRALEGMAAR